MLRCVFAPWLLVGCASTVLDTGSSDAGEAAPPLDSLDVVVGPTNLDLGEVFVGDSATGTFAVLNQSQEPLVVSVVVDSSQPGAWALSSAQASAQPGTYAEFSVTVEVTELVSYAGVVVVSDAWQRELGRVGLTVRTRVDADGDGFGAARYAGDDCNDDDPAVNPGATEVFYDGVDGDCDGASDFDADADGYDSAAHGGLDCDDTDATVSPSAEDPFYDGIDQDCSGDSDFDADADGFDAVAAGGLDCDDTLASVSPASGACWTGRVDATGVGLGFTGPVGSRFGAGLLADPDLLGEGPGLWVGAPASGLERGRIWHLSGPLTVGGQLDDVGVLVAEGTAGDRLGTTLAMGRPDGAAVPSVLVGAPGRSDGDGGVLWLGAPEGREAWWPGEGRTGETLAAGDLDGDGQEEVLAGGPGAVLVFDASGAHTPLPGDAGQTALEIGDLDGDGYTDAVLGRPSHTAAWRSDGAVFVVLGSASGVSLDAPSTVTLTTEDSDGAPGIGVAVLVADRDRDGQLDLVAADQAGGVHTLSGPFPRGAALLLTEASETWSGLDATQAPVLVGGDADEDGQEDLLTGLPGIGATAVWLEGGGSWADAGTRGVPRLDAPLGTLSALADLDGDSHADLAVGHPGSDRVFVLKGPALSLRATDSGEPSDPTQREQP